MGFESCAILPDSVTINDHKIIAGIFLISYDYFKTNFLILSLLLFWTL